MKGVAIFITTHEKSLNNNNEIFRSTVSSIFHSSFAPPNAILDLSSFSERLGLRAGG